MVPEDVYQLHTVHCERFLFTCKMCGELLPKARKKEHEEEEHAACQCEYCGETISADDLEKHKTRCELRPRTCRFCSTLFPFEEFIEHEDACGTRTEQCDNCAQYILKKDFPFHVVTCANGSLKRKRTDADDGRGKRGKHFNTK